MTALTQVSLVCDGCAEQTTLPQAALADARIAASAEGWSTAREGGHIDYCPKCRTPRVQRVGHVIAVAHGRRVIASQEFPANESPEQWSARVDAMRALLARTLNDDEQAAAMEEIFRFVEVESAVVGGMGG